MEKKDEQESQNSHSAAWPQDNPLLISQFLAIKWELQDTAPIFLLAAGLEAQERMQMTAFGKYKMLHASGFTKMAPELTKVMDFIPFKWFFNKNLRRNEYTMHEYNSAIKKERKNAIHSVDGLNCYTEWS